VTTQRLRIADWTFLVAEDNKLEQQLLIAVLKRAGAKRVLVANDGQTALDMLTTATSVDVIVTDLDMPVMDGLELIRRAGQAGYRRSFLIASALDQSLLASADAMAKAYGIKLLGALSKPVTQRLLEAALSHHGAPQPNLHGRSLGLNAFTPDEIVRGLKQDEFEPFFQPKVELGTTQVLRAEALARWRHPERGIVLPGAFIKILEDTGRIDDLTWLMLRKAIIFCATLNATGVESTVAVTP
jgi:CheY-like chemotaxis protein